MPDNLQPLSREIFVRHTDTSGKPHVMSHTVWDADRFLAARNKEAAELNAKARANKEPALAKAEQITQEQYLKEKN